MKTQILKQIIREVLNELENEESTQMKDIEEVINKLNEKDSKQGKQYKWNKQNLLKYVAWAEKKKLDPFNQDTVDMWKNLNVESKTK